MIKAPLPAIDRDNSAYWTGGARGELLIARCADCRYYVHPPTGFCPRCHAVFGAGVATCSDCRGVALKPFP